MFLYLVDIYVPRIYEGTVKHSYGTYKNKVIHRRGMVLTLCQLIKKVPYC
jgi:hypothetical protein